MTVLTFERIQ